MSDGVVFYLGPSLLTGAPIVAVATGLEGTSLNPKTGPMVQVWIIRSDIPPMDAKRQNLDDAVCGDCEFRGDGGFGSACYVPAWLGPLNVYKAYKRGDYPVVTPAELAALVEGRHVRMSAYGDAAAIPMETFTDVLLKAAGWVGYTHQWARAHPFLKQFLMASTRTLGQTLAARDAGWRTFRVRPSVDARLVGAEFACPASDEMGHRTTCQDCQLCRGTASPARHVAIVVHGFAGARAGWRRLTVVR